MEENHYERVDQFNRRVDEEGEHMNVMNNNYNDLFVKVKMEGVGIARKIDLNAFHSFEMLTTALIHMFNKSVEIEEEGVSYKLMYQNRDGHWHLGGDLPWEYETFLPFLLCLLYIKLNTHTYVYIET
ncbi:putative transcription factor interactor and regulator AUX-IAA family [Helianthus anomalus]